MKKDIKKTDTASFIMAGTKLRRNEGLLAQTFIGAQNKSEKIKTKKINKNNKDNAAYILSTTAILKNEGLLKQTLNSQIEDNENMNLYNSIVPNKKEMNIKTVSDNSDNWIDENNEMDYDIEVEKIIDNDSPEM